jgi:RNA polymerase-associated protein RTF1
MSDIDEELLALAGEASSDEEDAPVTATRSASESPVGNASSANKGTGKKSRRRGHTESEEEGEA